MKDRTSNSSKSMKRNEDKSIENPSASELRTLYDSLLKENKTTVSIQQVLENLSDMGISSDDERLKDTIGKYQHKGGKEETIDLKFQDFTELLEGDSSGFLQKAVSKKLSIPDFSGFCRDIEKYYHNTKSIKKGEAKNETDAKLYAISVCTVDGQQFQIGDHGAGFELQSVCKAINYPIALHERGEDKVHKHVGREPSGRSYNGLVLNQDGLPHNPMINAGAIMICSLIKPGKSTDERLGHVEEIWSRLCGNTTVRLNKKGYKPEPSARNMALSYYMKDQNAFPEGADLYEDIAFYGKCCSIEITNEQLAMAAASLANGGICPATGDKIFSPDNVRDSLSLMLSCGMYDYSGEFAFLVGLPAKSGVSGAMMVVVPGLMGIAIYSPPLDELGNPVRGVEFCKELVKEYSLHKFDHVADPENNKKDPRQPRQ